MQTLTTQKNELFPDSSWDRSLPKILLFAVGTEVLSEQLRQRLTQMQLGLNLPKPSPDVVGIQLFPKSSQMQVWMELFPISSQMPLGWMSSQMQVGAVSKVFPDTVVGRTSSKGSQMPSQMQLGQKFSQVF